MASSSMEARKDFASGGNGATGLIEAAMQSQTIGNTGTKATAPEVIFSEGSSRTWAYVGGKEVGFFEPGLRGDILMEINLSAHMKGLGIGSEIFSAAVDGETSFEATWVKSSIYSSGISDNLMQYQNARQKVLVQKMLRGVLGQDVRRKPMDLTGFLYRKLKME